MSSSQKESARPALESLAAALLCMHGVFHLESHAACVICEGYHYTTFCRSQLHLQLHLSTQYVGKRASRSMLRLSAGGQQNQSLHLLRWSRFPCLRRRTLACDRLWRTTEGSRDSAGSSFRPPRPWPGGKRFTVDRVFFVFFVSQTSPSLCVQKPRGEDTAGFESMALQ